MTSLPLAQSLRVLTIDGGGIKGYTALLILKRIFRTLKDEGNLVEEPRPCDVFDLITGTSTGGLIAVMLGRLHMTIDECIEQYKIVGARVFEKRPAAIGKLFKGMVNSPFYDIRILQEEIKKLLGSEALSLPVDEPFLENTDVRCKVMLCVTRKATSKPDVLRNYLSADPTQENYQCRIWEAASATSAAPMYFKSVMLEKTGEMWCDGGLRRNNPINEALTELHREKSWKDKQVGCIVSLGTGVAEIKSVSDNLAGFLRGAVEIMTDSEEIADVFAATKLGRELAESRRYFRFSVPQGMQQLEMNEWKEAEKMKALTDEYLRKVGSGNEVARCATSLLHPDENLQEFVSPKPSLLPYSPCVHFVDRPFYAQNLYNFYKTLRQDLQIFVLSGLGGVGKTQIALKFAQTMRFRFSIFWVRADTFNNYVTDYVKILRTLDPSYAAEVDSVDQMSLLPRTTAKLESQPMNWLLILDNADDIKQFLPQAGGQTNIQTYLPRRGRILITTRDQRFQGKVSAADNGLHVRPMSDQEARSLLLRSVPQHIMRGGPEESSTASEILKELGNLPLAIAQASANIEELRLTLAEYLAAYRDKQERMRLYEFPAVDFGTTDPRTSSQSVTITWELSFEHLEKEHRLSAICLCYMGLYHWRDIPRGLLIALPEFRDMKPIAYKQVISPLQHLSLIEETDVDGVVEYQIHPVVHERILIRLILEEKIRYLRPNIIIMRNIFPSSSGETGSDGALSRYLLPHAIHQIEVGMEIDLIDKTFSTLLQAVSNFLSLSGHTRFSTVLSKKALELAKKLWGFSDPSQYYIRMTMISCLNNDTQYEEAYNEANHALSQLDVMKHESVFTAEKAAIERCETLAYQAISCRGLDMQVESEAIHKEQLEINSSVLKDPANEVLFKHNLANCLKNQKRLVEAQQINEELLALAETPAGKVFVSRSLFLIMLNLKAHLIRATTGSDSITTLKEALPLYTKVFHESLDILGVRDIDTWKAANNVLGTLIQCSRYEEGVRVLETVFQALIDQKFRIEGQLLETFTYTWTLALSVISGIRRGNGRRPRDQASRLDQLMQDAIVASDVNLEGVMKSPDIVNTYGVNCQGQGDFQTAEKIHNIALELAILENKDQKLINVIYYNIMMAIARQPGRVAEAYAFRDKHLERIAAAEAIHGDLDFRLARIKTDLQTYEEAKRLMAAGKIAYDDEWWKDHEVALMRAEAIYGNIEAPEPKTANDVTLSEPVNGSPHPDNKPQKTKKGRFSLPAVSMALRSKEKGKGKETG